MNVWKHPGQILSIMGAVFLSIDTSCGSIVREGGQVWEHTPEQRVGASTSRRFSFGLRLTSGHIFLLRSEVRRPNRGRRPPTLGIQDDGRHSEENGQENKDETVNLPIMIATLNEYDHIVKWSYLLQLPQRVRGKIFTYCYVTDTHVQTHLQPWLPAFSLLSLPWKMMGKLPSVPHGLVLSPQWARFKKTSFLWKGAPLRCM